MGENNTYLLRLADDGTGLMATVPEPGTLGVLGLTLLVVLAFRRQRR